MFYRFCIFGNPQTNYELCITFDTDNALHFPFFQDFTLDFYFRQFWHDPRLAFSSEIGEELCISNEMVSHLWWPDTFFANAKHAKFHVATTKNAFLRIKPNGDVLHSLR